MQQQASLTQSPIAKTLFLFSLPILLSNALQSINQLINSMWIGRLLGVDALAATATTNILMFFLISSIFGIAMATVILIGQHIGAQNITEAKRIVGTSSISFFVLSVVLSGIGIVCTSQILNLLGTPSNIKHLAISYTQILFLGLPFLFGYNLPMAILRGSGDSKTPFYFLLLSVGLDILLNPLLILEMGPFPRMGISGSALATWIAQCFSLLALVLYLYRTKYMLRIRANELHLLRWIGK